MQNKASSNMNTKLTRSRPLMVRSASRTTNKSTRRRRPDNQNGPFAPRIRGDEVIERGLPGFRALRYRTKLNYSDVVTVTCGAGSAGTQVFSANGLYDPDITGTGHQPMPFDQLMLSFEHYCVLGAKLHANFRSGSNTTTLGVALSLSASSTAISDYQRLIENGNLVRARLNQYPYEGSSQTLVLPIDIGRFGSVPSLLSNPDYNGSVAANPVEQSYFHISCWNPDTISSGLAALVDVFIEYDAVFFEPRKNSISLDRALKRLILAEAKCPEKGN